MTQHNKNEHWAPCRNQTPTWYDWKIVESDVKPEQTTTTTQGIVHYTGHSSHTNQMLRFDPRFVQLSALGSWDSGFESLLRHTYHLTERDTRMLTCIASDVRDGVRNRSQDNVTNINTGSGVRRKIFKRQQCMYKVNNGILIKMCCPKMPVHAHTWRFFGYSQKNITNSSSLHFCLIFRQRLSRVHSACS